MRYYIDERSGCIAVMDTSRVNPFNNGLHEDSPGVVKYWQGHQVESTCPTCKHTRGAGWEINDEDRVSAHTICDELNASAVDVSKSDLEEIFTS